MSFWKMLGIIIVGKAILSELAEAAENENLMDFKKKLDENEQRRVEGLREMAEKRRIKNERVEQWKKEHGYKDPTKKELDEEIIKEFQEEWNKVGREPEMDLRCSKCRLNFGELHQSILDQIQYYHVLSVVTKRQ